MLYNPVQGPRIVSFGAARVASDVLPNGRPGFRVTQRYGDTDIFFGGKHGALDLGNFYCGDKLLAAKAGVVSNRKDAYGALIVEIRHTNGYTTGYGHLSSFAVANGTKVNAGTVIGYVGDTGLGGVCHCHFYVRNPSGHLVDPWPLLYQNMARYGRLNGNGINVRTSGYTIYATSVGGHIRRKSDNASLGSTSGRYRFGGWVTGQRHGIGPHPTQWGKLYIASAYRLVARPLMTVL